MVLEKAIAATTLRRAVLGAFLVAGTASASADPAAYVFTPYADVGQWQLAYGLGTEHARDGSRQTQQTLGLGGAPMERWYSSVYAAWAADDGGAFAIDEWSWTNHLRLTTPGSGPAEVGLLCELARPHDRGEGRLGVTCGPTLQMDTDDLQLNLNLSLGKHVGAQAPEPWQLGYQWQVKGMVAHDVEVGLQGIGSVGAWNHWAPTSGQQHTLGPAVFFKTNALGGPIRVDAAILFGVGRGSAKNLLRLRLQHEF
ncbi:MAG: hypothetical protein ABIR54_23730 [Burkholderiaceae bacterium]|jgi:hypothetical protein